jgi:hypothetical protein
MRFASVTEESTPIIRETRLMVRKARIIAVRLNHAAPGITPSCM